MENEKENAELNIGATFPSWLAIFLAALVWVCIGIVNWDYIAGGMSGWVFLSIALPLTFLGVWFILVAKASFKFNRWWREFKQELAVIKAQNDRGEDGRVAEGRE